MHFTVLRDYGIDASTLLYGNMSEHYSRAACLSTNTHTSFTDDTVPCVFSLSRILCIYMTNILKCAFPWFCLGFRMSVEVFCDGSVGLSGFYSAKSWDMGFGKQMK